MSRPSRLACSTHGLDIQIVTLCHRQPEAGARIPADMHGWRSATHSRRARPSWMICALARGEADLMRACVGVVRAAGDDGPAPAQRDRRRAHWPRAPVPGGGAGVHDRYRALADQSPVRAATVHRAEPSSSRAAGHCGSPEQARRMPSRQVSSVAASPGRSGRRISQQARARSSARRRAGAVAACGPGPWQHARPDRGQQLGGLADLQQGAEDGITGLGQVGEGGAPGPAR